MTVSARQIDHGIWSQSRYLAWLEDQPEGAHFEFDGARPVAMAPATVGHNRIGRNIRDAIRHKLPTGTPCDVYGPQDAIATVGGALREPDAFIACSRPPLNGVVVPAPVVVFEVVSPGRENRRRDEQERVDEYESVPTILRYVIVESERRGYNVFGVSLATAGGVEARRRPRSRSRCPSSVSRSRWKMSMRGSRSVRPEPGRARVGNLPAAARGAMSRA